MRGGPMYKPGQKTRAPHAKVMLLLRMMEAANGRIDASDSRYSLLNYFCGDFEPTDTFNAAREKGLIRTEFNDLFETSTAFLTDAGRAALARGSWTTADQTKGAQICAG